MSEPATDPEERARRAEEALAAARRGAQPAVGGAPARGTPSRPTLEYWRERASDIERSRWWRLGFPLRYLKRFRSDPAGMLEGRAAAIRRRRRDA